MAAGDEFSLVIDERGIPWTWGKNDKRQVRDKLISRAPGTLSIATRQNLHCNSTPVVGNHPGCEFGLAVIYQSS